MIEPGETRDHAQDVTEFSPALEAPVRGFADVGGESQAKQIDEIDVRSGMS